ncbi:MAG: hypothetical protein KDB26_00275, partial [Microthrixaceae bacterium]|nr:hypothetical protein [Microthrixaceae bacterium]
MAASRLVEAGPTERYPFDREALAPLVMSIQGLVLLGTCIFAAVTGVVILATGSTSRRAAADSLDEEL